jgi:hypothetical protein
MPEQFSKETLLVLHPADSAIQHSLQLLAERDELIGVAKAFESSRAIVASIDRASVQRLFSLAPRSGCVPGLIRPTERVREVARCAARGEVLFLVMPEAPASLI